MKVKCVVSCRDKDGMPKFCPVRIICTEEEYGNDDHYDKAKIQALEQGYENVGIVYDEFDGPSFLFKKLFKKRKKKSEKKE